MRRVSVVIPTYNRGYCLRRTIKSVISQTCDDWELVIVDNSSEDNTQRIISDFRDERIRLLQIQNNGIIAKSRNHGIEAASGEFIAFLDSDDKWLPTKLERSLEMLEVGCRLVHHDMYLAYGIDLETSRINNASRRLKRPVLGDLIGRGNAICTSSVVVESQLLKEVSGFSEDPEIVGIEDYDLWVRLAERTEEFGFIEEPLGFYTVDGNGTLNADLAARGLKAIAKRHSVQHKAVCNGTPSWILIPLAKDSVRKSPGDSIRYAVRALRRRDNIVSTMKSLVLLIIGFFFLARGYMWVNKGRISKEDRQ